MAKQDKATDRAQLTHALSLIGGLGFTMLSCIVVGFGIGYGIDKALNTSPIFLIVFLVVGVAGGMIRVYRMVMKTLE